MKCCSSRTILNRYYDEIKMCMHHHIYKYQYAKIHNECMQKYFSQLTIRRRWSQCWPRTHTIPHFASVMFSVRAYNNQLYTSVNLMVAIKVTVINLNNKILVCLNFFEYF